MHILINNNAKSLSPIPSLQLLTDIIIYSNWVANICGFCCRIGGSERLLRELRGEVLRLSERNLGRDDRVLSDSGREARAPFLDERVLRLLLPLCLGECPASENLGYFRYVGVLSHFFLIILTSSFCFQYIDRIPYCEVQVGLKSAAWSWRKVASSTGCSAPRSTRYFN